MSFCPSPAVTLDQQSAFHSVLCYCRHPLISTFNFLPAVLVCGHLRWEYYSEILWGDRFYEKFAAFIKVPFCVHYKVIDCIIMYGYIRMLWSVVYLVNWCFFLWQFLCILCFQCKNYITVALNFEVLKYTLMKICEPTLLSVLARFSVSFLVAWVLCCCSLSSVCVTSYSGKDDYVNIYF